MTQINADFMGLITRGLVLGNASLGVKKSAKSAFYPRYLRQ